jgi:hypothetical protein
MWNQTYHQINFTAQSVVLSLLKDGNKNLCFSLSWTLFSCGFAWNRWRSVSTDKAFSFIVLLTSSMISEYCGGQHRMETFVIHNVHDDHLD